MKKINLVLILVGILSFTSNAQYQFLPDKITQNDVRKYEGFVLIGANYWRFDSCLYSKQICKYNSHTGFNIKMSKIQESIIFEILRGNNSGYMSKIPYDTLKYVFNPDDISSSKFVRKLLIKEKYVRVDTFSLSVIDTLFFEKYSLIRKVFGRSEGYQKYALKIFVLKSVDEFGSNMFHFWVDKIGVVKLTDEKCWRYSFEMKDDRTRNIEKMYKEIMRVVKEKYKDPYWLGDECGVEI